MTLQDLGVDKSVLQNHYDRNRPAKAPIFQPVSATPHARKRIPPVDPDPQSRTLESYPRQWQEVITYAKCSFRAYVAGKCGFPEGVEGTQEAKECLEDAVEVFLEDGGILEPGAYCYSAHIRS